METFLRFAVYLIPKFFEKDFFVSFCPLFVFFQVNFLFCDHGRFTPSGNNNTEIPSALTPVSPRGDILLMIVQHQSLKTDVPSTEIYFPKQSYPCIHSNVVFSLIYVNIKRLPLK